MTEEPLRGLFYTAQQVADKLNMPLRTATRLIANGTIPGFKAGRQYRVPRQSLADFINLNSTAPGLLIVPGGPEDEEI